MTNHDDYLKKLPKEGQLKIKKRQLELGILENPHQRDEFPLNYKAILRELYPNETEGTLDLITYNVLHDLLWESRNKC